MKRISAFTAVFLLFGVLVANGAFAYDTEYYTYNGFDAVLSAWQLISSIFNNSVYNMLFFPITVLGILFGGAFFYFHLLGGGRAHGGSMLGWTFPILFGVIMYLGLFVPKGTVNLYDPVLNKYQPVSGIPNGITAAAGIFNTIERGLVDIINTSGGPLSYTDGAGGVGFDILNKSTTDLYTNAKLLDASLSKYVSDCVLFEINRPNSTLSVDAIVNNSGTGQDLWSLFLNAQNPAVNTTIYTSNQAGDIVDCSTAYTTLTGILNDPNQNGIQELIDSRCASAGFEMSDANEAQRCKDIMQKTLQFAEGGTAVSMDKFFQQTVLAQKMHDVVQNGGNNQAISATANIGIVSSTYSLGLIANEYLPLIRAIVTCIAISLLPFLVLFLPTPLAGKALAVAAGFFVWLTAWGVTDALTHTLATNYAYSYFDQIRANGTGYAAIMLMPSAATKAVGLFGMLRMAGMVIATVISSALIPLGSHAMSMFAGHFAGPVQGQGSAAGSVATPAGAAEAMQSYQGSRVSWSQAHAFKGDRLVAAKQYAAAKRIQVSLAESSLMPGVGPVTAGRSAGDAVGTRGASGIMTTKGSARKLGGAVNFVTRTAETGSSKEAAGVTMSEGGAQSLGISQQRFEEFSKGGKLLDREMADTLNKRFSLTHDNLMFREGMQVQFGYGSRGNVANVTGSMTTQKDFSVEDQYGKRYTIQKGARHTVEAAQGGGRAKTEGNIRDWSGHDGHEGHKGDVTFGSDGRVVNIEGKAGYSFTDHEDTVSSHRNLHTSEVGNKSWSGSVVRHENVKTNTVDHGQIIGHSLQMVLNKDKNLMSSLTNAKNEGERRAAIATIAQSLGHDIQDFISRSGISLDYSKADASINVRAGGNFGIGGASVDGSSGIGGSRQDVYNTNLMNREIVARIEKVDQEARSKGFKGDALSQYVTDKLYDDIDEMASKLKSNHPDKFGASAPGATIKSMFNKIKGGDNNSEGN